jgi:ligand-binding sensor domain-containing protein
MAYDNKGKIFVYSTRLDRFTLLHNLTDRLQGSGIVNEMAVDGQGHLWLGLTNGTYMLRANGRAGGHARRTCQPPAGHGQRHPGVQRTGH